MGRTCSDSQNPQAVNTMGPGPRSVVPVGMCPSCAGAQALRTRVCISAGPNAGAGLGLRGLSLIKFNTDYLTIHCLCLGLLF